MLTDEYFNDLSTYKETIQVFFADGNDYEVINKDKYAQLFLTKKNEQAVVLHPYALSSA